jgi:Mg2+/Co2+ transporter CorB
VLEIVTHKPKQQLLVTLLLCNCCVNETMPLFMDDLVPMWCALLISVTAVLIAGEIMPAAICTGPDKLAIAARCAPLLWIFVYVATPVALPIAWLLKRIIPEENTAISRDEVRALVEVHRELAREGGTAEPFNEDEEDMIKGALSLGTLTADTIDVLTPISNLFSISLDAVLDPLTMQRILDEGFSRVPVHLPADRNSLVGYILVKELIVLDPKEKMPVKSLFLYEPVCASPTLTLAQLLNEFQTGLSHMAFISKDHHLLKTAIQAFKDPEEAGSFDLSSFHRACVLGIVTLEDVLEVLLTEQVWDESDRKEAAIKLARFFRNVAIPKLRVLIANRPRSSTSIERRPSSRSQTFNSGSSDLFEDLEHGFDMSLSSPTLALTANNKFSKRRGSRVLTRKGQHILVDFSFGSERKQKLSSLGGTRDESGEILLENAQVLEKETLNLLHARQWTGSKTIKI